ncbi:MAG: 50S ribosomal protein L6 [Erysipelotrichia bacterium]|nr:50S ribosomal protein L6 [Erysipelotrichia bacterium]
MSRVGKLPINVDDKVKVNMVGNEIEITGPLGTLKRSIQNDKIIVEIENNQILVKRVSENKTVRAAHGLYRSLINNMVEGVTKGFQKNLIISGVGFRAVAQGEKIVLSLGFSHPVEILPPEGINIEIVTPTELAVKGIDKELVGQVAANIKANRKPDPYHGYGIRYKDETILRKEGKSAAKG